MPSGSLIKGLRYPDAARMAVDADIKTKIGGFHRAAMRSATVPALKDEIPSLVCDLHDARERRNKSQHGPCLSIDEAGDGCQNRREAEAF
jgi:hypothetical protein